MNSWGDIALRVLVALALAFSTVGFLTTRDMPNQLSDQLYADLGRITSQQKDESKMTKTSTWTDAEGVTHTLTTNQVQGETEEQMLARHQRALTKALEMFPPAQ